MTIKLVNMTDYSNIYAVYDENGKRIGSIQHTLAGRFAGIYFDNYSARHTKWDIRRAWKQYITEKNTAPNIEQ